MPKPSADARIATTVISCVATLATLTVTAPTGSAAPAAPRQHPTCRTADQLSLSDVVDFTAASLRQSMPSAMAPAIDAAGATVSGWLDRSRVSALAVIDPAVDVSQETAASGMHSSNALVQQVIAIKNGTYRTQYRASDLTLNEALEDSLLGLELAANFSPVLSTVPEIAGLLGKYVEAYTTQNCLAGPGPVHHRSPLPAPTTIPAQVMTDVRKVDLADATCAPIASESLGQFTTRVLREERDRVSPAQRGSYDAEGKRILAALNTIRVPKNALPLEAADLGTLGTVLDILGPFPLYVGGVVRQSDERSWSQAIPASQVQLDDAFDMAEAATDLLDDIATVGATVVSAVIGLPDVVNAAGPTYVLKTTQGVLESLCFSDTRHRVTAPSRRTSSRPH